MDFSLKFTTFAVPLPDSIMVVRQILDLNVEVRALVGQQKSKENACKSKVYRHFPLWGAHPATGLCPLFRPQLPDHPLAPGIWPQPFYNIISEAPEAGAR
jgi:hypothetical protein